MFILNLFPSIHNITFIATYLNQTFINIYDHYICTYPADHITIIWHIYTLYVIGIDLILFYA